MIAARLAGIHVFATGGIGGVHKGAELTFDISADLLELAQTPVTVVAAGAKAILDIPKTLEVLETQGVPVIAYGQDDMPAFWSRESGLPAAHADLDPAGVVPMAMIENIERITKRRQAQLGTAARAMPVRCDAHAQFLTCRRSGRDGRKGRASSQRKT